MELIHSGKEFSFDTAIELQGNYQNYFFNNIDFSAVTSPFSFYRSDFRNAKLLNCQFYKNNIDRSDFTNVFIKDCIFENNYFGNSGICNSIVKDTTFLRVKMDGAEISRTSFMNCTFDGTDFLNSTVFDIDFINCNFRGCSFEKAGFENIRFEKCNLENIDFADLSAVNFSFIQCNLDNTTLNYDSLGTYLFDNFDFDKFRFRYLNKNIDRNNINCELTQNFVNYLFTQRRCYEYFNMSIYFNSCIKSNLLNAFSASINEILKIDNEYERSENIKYLFQSLEFHFKYKQISFLELIEILYVTQDIYKGIDNFATMYQLQERHKYILEKMKYGYFDDVIYNDNDFINTIAKMTITFSLNNEKEALNYLNIILIYFEKIHQVKHNNIFQINKVYQGSIIVEILTYAGSALLLSHVIKQASDNLLKMVVNYNIAKKAIPLINNTKNLDDLKKAKLLLDKSNPSDDLKSAANLIKSIEIET